MSDGCALVLLAIVFLFGLFCEPIVEALFTRFGW